MTLEQRPGSWRGGSCRALEEKLPGGGKEGHRGLPWRWAGRVLGTALWGGGGVVGGEVRWQWKRVEPWEGFKPASDVFLTCYQGHSASFPYNINFQ